MARILARIVLLAVGVVYLAFMAIHGTGQWLLDHPTRENLERGIRWDAGNPALWARYGRDWAFLPDSAQSKRAADAYRQAVLLNPLDPDHWNGLASAYEQMGDQQSSEAALRSELAVVPFSPEASWRLANFLIVRGRTREALPYLRTAAREPSFRAAVFDLGWKLLDNPETILRELVPPGVQAHADYLGFLLARKKLAEAYPAWKEVQAGEPALVAKLGNAYVGALAAAGMGSDAARVWDELLGITGRTAVKTPGELLTNRDFEVSLINDGLDWRWNKGSGYQVSLDEFVIQNGTRSLRVTFDGTANPDFLEVWQVVPVEPGRRYRFQGYLKTENITTDQGMHFSLNTLGAPPGEAFSQTTENRVDSNPWLQEQLDFRTGPHTSVVVVGLRRFPSRKLDHLLQGKVWIDNLSLRPVKE